MGATWSFAVLLIIIAVFALIIIYIILYIAIYTIPNFIFKKIYKPGTGKILTYKAYFDSFGNWLFKYLLDDCNIPYRHARIIDISHNNDYGARKEYTYTIEYWPK